jgi:hypothetical protein
MTFHNSHYFPVKSQKVCFSRTGFVYVKNWKNSENNSISQLCVLFVIYLRFIITLVKGMFDLQIDKNKNYTKSWPFHRRWLGECQLCTNRFSFLSFNVIQNIHMYNILTMWCWFFFQNFYSLKIIFIIFIFINLQVEHTLDKCYNEPATTFRLGPKNSFSVEPFCLCKKLKE